MLIVLNELDNTVESTILPVFLSANKNCVPAKWSSINKDAFRFGIVLSDCIGLCFLSGLKRQIKLWKK